MIFTMRDMYFEAGKDQGYFEALEKLEQEGKIEKHKRVNYLLYPGMKEEDGTAFGVYKETPASCHVYKVIV